MPRKQRNRYRRFNFGAASRFNNKDAVEDRLLFQGQEAACGSAQAMAAVALVGDSVTLSQGWGGEDSCTAQNGQPAATAPPSEGENQVSVSQEAAKMSVLLEEDLVTKWCSAKQQRGFVEDKDFISYLLFIVSEYETITGTYVLQPVPTPKSPTKPVTRQQASKKRSYLFDEPDNEGKEKAKKGKKRKKQSKVVRAASPLLVDVSPRPKSPEKEQLTEICDDNPKKEVAKIGKDSPKKEQVAEMYEGNPKEQLAEVCKDNPKKAQVAEIRENNPKKEQVAEICKGSPKKEHFAERYKGNPKEQLAEICDNYLKYGVKKEQLAEICDNYVKYDVKKEQLAEICEDNPLDLSINSHKEESGEGKNTANTTGTSELQKILTDTKVTSGYDMEGQNVIPEEAILDFSTKKTSPDANANIAVFAEKKKKKGFPCGVCGKVFCRRQHLARHMRTHADVKMEEKMVPKMEDKMVPKMEDKMMPKMEDKMVPCDVCGEVVSGKEWGHHRKTHDQGQIFQCSWEGCSLAFKDRKLWQDHMSFVHKGQRSVPCTWIGCDKTFPKHSQMERHLKVHITPRRMFSCPVCHKVFRHKPNLSVHMRMHSGETPFKCPHCDYRGRQQSALKWHMKKHHDTIVTSFVSFKMDDAAAVPEPDSLTSKLAEKMWRESGPTSTGIPLVSYM